MRIFLYGAFAGNRGDVLMETAVTEALEKRGLEITDNEEAADAILNCCGYWCGDPWGELWARKMRERVLHWKESGKKLVFLPQTFGPFTDKRIADELGIIVHHAHLVCPRDAQSSRFLTDVCGEQETIRAFPDYTMNVAAFSSRTFVPGNMSVAIIPNLRMTDKTDARVSAQYMPFLGSVIALLRDGGADPYLLIHEEKDITIADALRQEYPDLMVVTESDARQTKWIIGQSRAVVSSRYHGILNALYQDVPVLATSWCHKFPALMEEWQMKDRLIDVTATDEELHTAVRHLLDADAWTATHETRAAIQTQYQNRTEELWNLVAQTLQTGTLTA